MSGAAEQATRSTAPDPGEEDLPERRRIVLVEDEGAIVTLITATLEREGFEVVAVADGREALGLCGEGGDRVDLLISDVVVPGMGGADLAAEVRAQRDGLPVLLMSGYPGDRIDLVEFERGRTEFLAKPFRLAELLDAVHRLVASG